MLFHDGQIVRAKKSGRACIILASWDNGSQMLYLIQFREGEAPQWVSGDMLKS